MSMSENELVMRVSSSMMWLILRITNQPLQYITKQPLYYITKQRLYTRRRCTVHACERVYAIYIYIPQHHSMRAPQQLGVHGHMSADGGRGRVRGGQDDVRVVGMGLLQADGEVGGARRYAIG